MVDYYCDLDRDYSNENGIDIVGCYRGMGGLQAAFRGTGDATALTENGPPAFDHLHVKGAAVNHAERLVWLNCGKDVSHWSLEDELRDNGGGGAEWTGVVCEVSYAAQNDEILVELDAGYSQDEIDLANGIQNTTIADSTTLSAKASKGVEVDENSGNPGAGKPIIISGVNGSWANDGSLVCIDGDSWATSAFTADNTGGFLFENFEFRNFVESGFGISNTANVYYWGFHNIHSHTNGRDGIGANNGASRSFGYSLILGCSLLDNSRHGASYFSYGSLLALNDMSRNSSYGYGYGDVSLWANLMQGNGSRPYYFGRGSVLQNVLDDNGTSGLYAGYGPTLLAFNRVTNNPVGFWASTCLALDFWNYYNGNAALEQGDVIIHERFGVDTRLTGLPQGYEDAAAGKFMLRIGATGLRTEIPIGSVDSDNRIVTCRGLPNSMLPPAGRGGGAA